MGTIYCDNYFKFWFNGKLIANDPLYFTPHQARHVTFGGDGCSNKMYVIMCQDFATQPGYEYMYGKKLLVPCLGLEMVLLLLNSVMG
jgi:hypothetical protein